MNMYTEHKKTLHFLNLKILFNYAYFVLSVRFCTTFFTFNFGIKMCFDIEKGFSLSKNADAIRFCISSLKHIN